MMDHERTEKELQEIFEEIQRSYEAFMDDALALQERTLGFAREVLESPTEQEEEAEGLRATLEELVEKSRGERERFERLARKSSEAYMKVLKGEGEFRPDGQRCGSNPRSRSSIRSRYERIAHPAAKTDWRPSLSHRARRGIIAAISRSLRSA